MKLGGDDHERFLKAANDLEAKHHVGIVGGIFETSMARTLRLLAGEEVPDDHAIKVVAELSGVTVGTLLSGVETAPTSIEEAIALGRGQALLQALSLIERHAKWYAGPGRQPKTAEGIRSCCPLLVVNRVDPGPLLTSLRESRSEQ